MSAQRHDPSPVSRRGVSRASRRLRLLALAASALVFQGAAHGAPADPIFPQDRLLLKVLEWLPARGEYKEWTAVGGEYVVAPDQSISVPFVGRVSTTGRSRVDLAADIARQLQQKVSLPQMPDVSVEFGARSPVFVLGGVETPGKVDYAPGLTAIEAIALAGGFYRGAGGTMRLERDQISAAGTIKLAQYEAARAEAQLVRLEQELAGGETLSVDAKRWTVEIPKTMLDQEQQILEVRRDARMSRLRSIENIRQVAQDQLGTLKSKADNLDRQIEIARQELQDVQGLVGKGLAVASRGFTLDRLLSELEGKRLDVDVAVLQANLQISEAERDAVDVATSFRSEVSVDIQAARSSLEASLNGIETAQGLLREATVIAPTKLLDRAGNLQIGVRIVLTRETGEAPASFEVSPNEKLRSGDTIQVEMTPDTAPDPLAPRS